MDVQEALKTAMKEKGIKQSFVAEKLGINQSSLSMYLKSNMSIKTENLVKFANACGLRLVLVDGDDQNIAYVIGEGDAPGRKESDTFGDENFDERVRRIVAEELKKAGVK